MNARLVFLFVAAFGICWLVFLLAPSQRSLGQPGNVTELATEENSTLSPEINRLIQFLETVRAADRYRKSLFGVNVSVCLPYKIVFGLCNQQLGHIYSFVAAMLIGAEHIIIPPSVARNSSFETNDIGSPIYFNTPMNHLWDVDRITRMYGALGLTFEVNEDERPERCKQWTPAGVDPQSLVYISIARLQFSVTFLVDFLNAMKAELRKHSPLDVEKHYVFCVEDGLSHWVGAKHPNAAGEPFHADFRWPSWLFQIALDIWRPPPIPKAVLDRIVPADVRSRGEFGVWHARGEPDFFFPGFQFELQLEDFQSKRSTYFPSIRYWHVISGLTIEDFDAAKNLTAMSAKNQANWNTAARRARVLEEMRRRGEVHYIAHNDSIRSELFEGWSVERVAAFDLALAMECSAFMGNGQSSFSIQISQFLGAVKGNWHSFLTGYTRRANSLFVYETIPEEWFAMHT